MVNARETVDGDTPAASATSWMLAFIWHPFATRQQPAVLCAFRCCKPLQKLSRRSAHVHARAGGGLRARYLARVNIPARGGTALVPNGLINSARAASTRISGRVDQVLFRGWPRQARAARIGRVTQPRA